MVFILRVISYRKKFKLIFSLIIWSRSGKKHMVTFPLRPVTFPGYVFTSNTGDDTGIQLALSKDTRVGIEEFIASGKAGKPNRTTHHAFNALLRDLSLRSAFNFFTCNQSEHLWDFIESFRLQFAQLIILVSQQAWIFCIISLLQLKD